MCSLQTDNGRWIKCAGVESKKTDKCDRGLSRYYKYGVKLVICLFAQCLHSPCGSGAHRQVTGCTGRDNSCVVSRVCSSGTWLYLSHGRIERNVLFNSTLNTF